VNSLLLLYTRDVDKSKESVISTLFWDFYEIEKVVHELRCSRTQARGIALIADRSIRKDKAEKYVENHGKKAGWKKRVCSCAFCREQKHTKITSSMAELEFPTFSDFLRDYMDLEDVQTCLRSRFNDEGKLYICTYLENDSNIRTIYYRRYY
jgi:hypothetical protein